MRRALTVLLLLLPLLAGCAGPAGGTTAASSAPTPSHSRSAGDTLVVHGTGTARPFDEHELQDLETVAKGTGQPLEEVLAEQRGAAEFRTLTEALYDDPGTGAVMAWRDAGAGFVTFTHRPSAAVLQRLCALPIDTAVEWGMPMTHHEFVRYAESVVGRVSEVAGLQFLQGGPNEIGDAVEIRYARTGADGPTEEALQAAVDRAARPWGDAPRPAVRFTVGDLSEREAIRAM